VPDTDALAHGRALSGQAVILDDGRLRDAAIGELLRIVPFVEGAG
jgi:hypothetical protein